MAISYVKVRARVITENLDVSTPYVTSMDVNIPRGGMSTCSLTLKIKGANSVTVADYIQVYAGPAEDMVGVFRGFVKSAQITPCWDDPSFIMLQLNCEDALGRLNGMKFTRREATKLSVWATIDSVSKKASSSTYLKFRSEDSEAPSDAEQRDNSLSVKPPAPKFGSVIGGQAQSGIPIVIEEYLGS